MLSFYFGATFLYVNSILFYEDRMVRLKEIRTKNRDKYLKIYGSLDIREDVPDSEADELLSRFTRIYESHIAKYGLEPLYKTVPGIILQDVLDFAETLAYIDPYRDTAFSTAMELIVDQGYDFYDVKNFFKEIARNRRYDIYFHLAVGDLDGVKAHFDRLSNWFTLKQLVDLVFTFSASFYESLGRKPMSEKYDVIIDALERRIEIAENEKGYCRSLSEMMIKDIIPLNLSVGRSLEHPRELLSREELEMFDEATIELYRTLVDIVVPGEVEYVSNTDVIWNCNGVVVPEIFGEVYESCLMPVKHEDRSSAWMGVSVLCEGLRNIFRDEYLLEKLMSSTSFYLEHKAQDVRTMGLHNLTFPTSKTIIPFLKSYGKLGSLFISSPERAIILFAHDLTPEEVAARLTVGGRI